MGFVKSLSKISGALNLLANLTASIFYISYCVVFSFGPYSIRQLFEDNFGFESTPIWIFFVLSIFFVRASYCNVELLKGIHKDNYKAIGSFISTMQLIVLILLIRLFAVLFSFIRYPNRLVILMELGYILFIITSSIPFYILYKDIKGDNYVVDSTECSCCIPAYKPTERRTMVPNSEV